MRLRVRFDVLSATVFTAAGVLPLACGGSSTSERVGNGNGNGNGGDQAAGHPGVGGANGGMSAAAGGSSAGTRSVAGNGSSGTTGATAGKSGTGGSSGFAGSATGGAPSVGGAGGRGGGAGGSGATAGAGMAGASGDAGATSDNPFPCVAPQPLVAGSDTGFFVCQSGYTHREKVATCPSNLPRPTALPNPNDAGTTCTSDADCTEHPYGHCETATPPLLTNVCDYGCVGDSDCSAGSFCVCGADIGSCMTTTCTSDADCTPGFLCASYSLSCSTGFSCQAPGDACGANSDCDALDAGLDRPRCSGPSPRVCASSFPCGTGRPFLVDGGARLALLGRRADWLEIGLTPNLTGIEPALREKLAAEWSRAGLMEHASIAAFARFTLQLVSLGAPASLVELAAAAMSDETRHAKVCFALASAYAGSELGPERLAVEESLSDLSLTGIVLTTIREGCVGETIAAAEAMEASLNATDPVLQNALAAISADETRHAELAWRFVRYALERGGAALRLAAQREFDAIERELGEEPSVEASTTDAAFLEHGVLTRAVRHAVRAATLRHVISPGAKGLLAAEAGASFTGLVPLPAA